MESTQQPVPTAASTGIFGTKIPASAAFAIGILFFFLPFAEIRCGGTVVARNSGLNIAIGKEWQTPGSGKGFFDDMNDAKETVKANKQNPNYYAIASLGLGVVGLLFSFARARAAAGGAAVSGVLSAAALIGLMFDLKKKVSSDPSLNQSKGDDGGLFTLDKMADSIKPVIAFTPWFWAALIALLAAAVFSYMRMKSAKL
jgi:hypothetical protein